MNEDDSPSTESLLALLDGLEDAVANMPVEPIRIIEPFVPPVAAARNVVVRPNPVAALPIPAPAAPPLRPTTSAAMPLSSRLPPAAAMTLRRTGAAPLPAVEAQRSHRIEARLTPTQDPAPTSQGYSATRKMAGSWLADFPWEAMKL